MNKFLGLMAGLALAGCATAPPETPRRASADWHPVTLPGKAATRYTWTDKAGRRALRAEAERSASMLRRHLNLPPQAFREVRFSWWVEALPHEADVAVAEREDAAARVILAFGGDASRLSARNRAMFDLAEALTGERPPFATLMYVYERQAPVESVIVNPRTDRIRKIVLDSGPQSLGRWREHRRDIAADFRRAFGEDPGPLLAVAVMTDADNTAARALAWYTPVEVVGND